jgi:hypothetical protein
MSKTVCRFCEALDSVFDDDKLVEYKEGILHIGGHIPTDQQLQELANEIVLLRKTSIWSLLTETVKAQAIDLGIKKAKDFDQLLFAKAMLHVVALQENAIDAIHAEYLQRKKVASIK